MVAMWRSRTSTKTHTTPTFASITTSSLYNGDGSFTLRGYPEQVFPPTDFHTTTLVGDTIFLIGSLGHMGTRHYGKTPVYRLHYATWSVERVRTRGTGPGWLSCHRASYDAGRHCLRLDGGMLGVVETARDSISTDATAPGHAKNEPIERYVDNNQSFERDLGNMTWCRNPEPGAA